MRRWWPAWLAVLWIVTACTPTQPEIKEPPSSSPERLAQINTQLGIEYMKDGNNEVAMKKLQKALELAPHSVDAHNAIALLFSQLGEYDEAEKHFKEALRIDKNNAAALNNYGQFLCKRGRHADGEALFTKVLADPLYSTPAVAYTNAGLCAADAGDAAKAEDYFRKALQTNPQDPTALLRMAELSYTQQQLLPARAYLQRYSEVAQHTPRSLWLGVRIERELGDKDALASYTLSLKNNFPDSDETRQLLESEVH